jgi:hypothetical protein
MDYASIINFLSNEDTQELAPGFFIDKKYQNQDGFQCPMLIRHGQV